MGFLIRVVINAFAIWVVTLIPALQVSVIPFPPGETLQLVLTLLIVAAIFALVNTITMAVLERTREIGMLRSVGARARDIRRIFATEGLVVAAVEVVRQAAAVTLSRQVEVADDPIAVGLEHDAFDSHLHAPVISALGPVP